jgi:hypothetical protein
MVRTFFYHGNLLILYNQDHDSLDLPDYLINCLNLDSHDLPDYIII